MKTHTYKGFIIENTAAPRFKYKALIDGQWLQSETLRGMKITINDHLLKQRESNNA